MNFDNSRKNYSGLAFVAVLHLAVAGFIVTHSKISIIRATEPEPFKVTPLPPDVVEPPPPVEHFEVEFTKPTVITPPPPFEERWPDGPTITTEHGETTTNVDTLPGPGKDRVVDVDPPRKAAPVNIAAVIDVASCAKPAYPAAALRNGDEGTVTLAFLVGKDGHVASAKVERTSGHRDLDRAALQGLSNCAFKPGTIDGVAQESWARMQYAWRLDE